MDIATTTGAHLLDVEYPVAYPNVDGKLLASMLQSLTTIVAHPVLESVRGLQASL